MFLDVLEHEKLEITGTPSPYIWTVPAGGNSFHSLFYDKWLALFNLETGNPNNTKELIALKTCGMVRERF